MTRVWAPLAEHVELEIGQRRQPMRRDASGWWHGPSLEHGEDYRFRIGGDAFPDPRSPWQPAGVRGASRHVDHRRFAWTDRHWQAPPLGSALIYELHLGTFTPEGTFAAATERLEHVVELGVTHVEVMPIAEFLGNYGWGYDGVSLFAPHHAYGGPDGFKRFVNACHERGLAVLLDVVYNHLGPSGNYLPKFGPYFSERHATPWGSAINFDGPYSDEVRRFFCDNAVMWLRDYHCDGLRLDAVHAIVDTSAVPFLEQLAAEVDELKAHLGRHLVLIAESDLNDPRVVRPGELGGFGLDAQWSDDIHHAVHGVLTGEREGYYADFGDLADLAAAMERPFVYAGRHSRFRQRRHGRLPINLSPHRFIAYQQNHDQLGNRARGERLGHLVSDERLRIGAALILLSPYVPMLFQGEEWGATAPFQYFVDFHEEPELARAVAAGRLKEFAAFGWDPAAIPDPTSRETFVRSQLRWEERGEARHAELLEWYRALIAIRRRFSALTSPRADLVQASFDAAEAWLRIERGNVTIVGNFSADRRTIGLADERQREIVLASRHPVELSGASLALPAESVAVLASAVDDPPQHPLPPL